MIVQVTKLCDLGIDDLVCSVGWAQRGTHLAVGTSNGKVQVRDYALIASVLFTYSYHGFPRMIFDDHVLCFKLCLGVRFYCNPFCREKWCCKL